jgi:hypothetical protein
MAFTHLIAASSAAITVSRVRSTTTSPAAAFARLPATPHKNHSDLFKNLFFLRGDLFKNLQPYPCMIQHILD